MPKHHVRDYKTTCPTCGYEADANTNINPNSDTEPGPKFGDMSLCIACGNPAIFEPDPVNPERFTMRLLTRTEMSLAETLPQFIEARAHIRQMRTNPLHPRGPDDDIAVAGEEFERVASLPAEHTQLLEAEDVTLNIPEHHFVVAVKQDGGIHIMSVLHPRDILEGLKQVVQEMEKRMNQ